MQRSAQTWSEKQAKAALIDLSRVRDDRVPDDENAGAREFRATWTVSESDQAIRQHAFDVREVASLAGDLQRNDIASLRKWAGPGSDRDVTDKAQARVADLVNRNTRDVDAQFVPVVGTRGFMRRRVPQSLLSAVYLQLEARILQGKRLHVCDRKQCHAIFLRDDERDQRYCSPKCERMVYYRANLKQIKEKRRKTAARRKGGRS